MVVRKVLFVMVVLVLPAVVGVAPAGSSALTPCNASQLVGTFTRVPGSAAAGSVSYRLALVNRSRSGCFVTGIPGLVLLDAGGRALPTSVRPASPGVATSAKIGLAPGAAATADARFSPDVPGPGEQHPGACERTAYVLAVSPTPGRGRLSVSVSPPTPVCEKGHLSLSLLKGGGALAYSVCLGNAGGVTSAMLDCIGAEYARLSALLSSVYRKLLVSVGDRQKLAASESRWLAFRNADCKFAGSINAGGSLESVDVGICLVDRTTTRIKQLRSYQKAAGPH
jgi:uncharacterized protein YecT (DUF1311 family)